MQIIFLLLVERQSQGPAVLTAMSPAFENRGDYRQ